MLPPYPTRHWPTQRSKEWNTNRASLQGYEVREYVLEKWGRACAYCHATNVPLQIEHIVPKSRGGSN